MKAESGAAESGRRGRNGRGRVRRSGVELLVVRAQPVVVARMQRGAARGVLRAGGAGGGARGPPAPALRRVSRAAVRRAPCTHRGRYERAARLAEPMITSFGVAGCRTRGTAARWWTESLIKLQTLYYSAPASTCPYSSIKFKRQRRFAFEPGGTAFNPDRERPMSLQLQVWSTTPRTLARRAVDAGGGREESLDAE
ncbi:hypothetical protein EVAR_50858_1 [Eumeta japonica]|uniref:Uncharacterized protein n=1 Tax=Eumeta variegata TaxID=151549 RepID=A0A4C1Y7G0_EUMVA|nr:hypothetical protein EVAR_50858_1 [Eumeta japonica]